MAPKRAPKKPLLPEVFPTGTAVKTYTIKKYLGAGAFGRVYLAADRDKREVALKVEFAASGPLFCEQAFASRCLKLETRAAFTSRHKLPHLPLPEYYGLGTFTRGEVDHRFLAFQRLGHDLESEMKDMAVPQAFQAVYHLLWAVQFMAEHGYVHADIKSSNMMLGHASQAGKVFLIDFGLAYKHCPEYKPNKKQAHNGTALYTSRDAHVGARPSMRGDVEIIAFNLLHWIAGKKLPWYSLVGDKLQVDVATKEKIHAAKEKLMADLPKSLQVAAGHTCPHLVKLFRTVSKLKYEETPPYKDLRDICLAAMKPAKLTPASPFRPDTRVSSSSEAVTATASASSAESSPERAVSRKRPAASPSKKPAAKKRPLAEKRYSPSILPSTSIVPAVSASTAGTSKRTAPVPAVLLKENKVGHNSKKITTATTASASASLATIDEDSPAGSSRSPPRSPSSSPPRRRRNPRRALPPSTYSDLDITADLSGIPSKRLR